uniref:NADH dehydrogenase subunit 4L n=1 Tax=Abrus daozhenensis TaxID=2959344 RepID=UPI002114233A|nr:NADH dehydrogenase subunit 4L [Abrus daozhenensis]YP_010431999.1 NADH dehydrogenase subunit 4L [Abrus yunshanensis]USS62521.1 NADH dehydrogenase subunit 4L [Abrus daozhenensis]USS62534.1 NADH dehydrogenase subunit 4L [Abrus yunshanensis]
MFYFFIYMYYMCIFSLLIIRKHIFLCLLSLEFIVVSLMMMMVYFLLFFTSGYYFMVILMVFFVCEGVLGLSVLVNMIRCYGNDYLNSLGLW